MTSEKIRDPVADHLLTPQNCALAIVDYQPQGYLASGLQASFKWAGRRTP